MGKYLKKSEVHGYTDTPYLNLIAAIIKSGLEDKDLIFFKSNYGKQICSILDVSSQYCIDLIKEGESNV